MRQMEIFRILSAILHLGNVILEEDNTETSYVRVRNLLIKYSVVFWIIFVCIL